MIKPFFDWVQWFFWTSRRCRHEKFEMRLADMGRCKLKVCKQCKKVLAVF
jgi:hypothetical protein